MGARVGINTTLTIWVLSPLPYEKDKYPSSNSQRGNWSNHCTNSDPCGTLNTRVEQRMKYMPPQTKLWQSSA